MATLTLIVTSMALSRRTYQFRDTGKRWGKDVIDSPAEVAICSMEALAWVFIGYGCTAFDQTIDYDRVILASACLVALVAAICTLVDLNGDSAFDTLRRLLALYLSAVTLQPFAGLLVLSGLSYRIMMGMGIAAKEMSWGLHRSQKKPSFKALNILVLSIGTRGDVQPFIHLGQEMKGRGHTVTICALEKYRGLVERGGLAFRNAGIDDIEESKFWRKCRHVSEVMADAIPNFSLNFMKIGAALYEAAASSHADVLVVTSTAQSISLSISEKLKIPTFVVKFAPDVPTRAFPAPGYEGRRSFIGRVCVPSAVYNLFSWYNHWFRIALASFKCRLGVVENKYRKEILGLGPLKGGLRLKEMGDCPNLCAFSNVVVPTPRDWPGNCLVTGWWLPIKKRRMSMHKARDEKLSPSSSSSSVSTSATLVDEENEEDVPENVLDFLGDNKDVICITFGSMSPTADALGLVPLVLKACEKTFGKETRVLIVGGRFVKFATVSVSSVENGANIMVIDEAPYHKLFPLVRLVVHHGGAGTSASTLETCVPSLVIPVLVWTDQPLWASQLELLGVGIHVEQQFAFCANDTSERQQLEAKFLSECQSALAKLTEEGKNPEKMLRREQVADLLADENGVEKAADAIEFVVRST